MQRQVKKAYSPLFSLLSNPLNPFFMLPLQLGPLLRKISSYSFVDHSEILSQIIHQPLETGMNRSVAFLSGAKSSGTCFNSASTFVSVYCHIQLEFFGGFHFVHCIWQILLVHVAENIQTNHLIDHNQYTVFWSYEDASLLNYH